MKSVVKITTYFLLLLSTEHLPDYLGETGCFYPDITVKSVSLVTDLEPLALPSGYFIERGQCTNIPDQLRTKSQYASKQVAILFSEKEPQRFYRQGLPEVTIREHHFEADRAPPKYISRTS